MICDKIQHLIAYAMKKNLITEADQFVVQNQLMEALHLTDWQLSESDSFCEESIDAILQPLIDYACTNGIIADTAVSRDLFDTKLMGIFTPMPHEMIALFRQHYQESPEAATDWYYDISQKLNYVRAGRIAKDKKWKYASQYGMLDITINRSKPEKDPRDIAAARNQKAAAYPKCQLCPENAGFAGNLNHPARQNLRPIPMKIFGQDWQLQYSPYGYYNEHCIVFHEAHVPMKVDHTIFEKLLDVLDFLPHYFVGSNADLPIVGGSILSHEHFQGGHYTFAMAVASIETPITLAKYPTVQAGILKWPMSVIRLTSIDRKALSDACNQILEQWRVYSDPTVDVFAETDGIPHNTITPIARKKGEVYECDLVLRNNRTSETRPLGIFHPHPALHHIKKENIGLIEVMGLAVLPARLAVELEKLQQAMLSGADLTADPQTAEHAVWATDILQRHPEFCAENAEAILQAEVGAVFEQVLCDAGVFKRDAIGKAAFLRFLQLFV